MILWWMHVRWLSATGNSFASEKRLRLPCLMQRNIKQFAVCLRPEPFPLRWSVLINVRWARFIAGPAAAQWTSPFQNSTYGSTLAWGMSFHGYYGQNPIKTQSSMRNAKSKMLISKGVKVQKQTHRWFAEFIALVFLKLSWNSNTVCSHIAFGRGNTSHLHTHQASRCANSRQNTQLSVVRTSILDIQEDMRFSWQMPHGSKE